MTRDKNRTPMQWSQRANGGFCPPESRPGCRSIPTMPRASTSPTSTTTRSRCSTSTADSSRYGGEVPALVAGEYRPLHEAADGYVAFLRTTEAQTVLVLLSYSNARHDLRFNVPGKQTAHVRFSSGGNSGDLNLAAIRLDAYEVLIAELR